jgi:hypothetical protein
LIHLYIPPQEENIYWKKEVFNKKKGIYSWEKFEKKMVESWLCTKYTEYMKYRWLLSCLILSFLLFLIAPSFHHHDHFVTDSNCHFCMLGFHRLQLILQDSFQLPAPISKTAPLLIQEQEIFFSVEKNVFSNRSPPL